VDVELVSEKVERVKHKFLTPEELLLAEKTAEAWQRSSVNSQLSTVNCQLLTSCWSIKEALFKWKGSGEVDFRKHLRIERLQIKGNEGTAQCRVLKDSNTALTVQLLFFNDNCLSWVMS
jgi:4'-phosphopantetheinyl transferase